MLRLILRNACNFARQTRRNRTSTEQPAVEMSLDEEQPTTAQNRYKALKEKVNKEDQIAREQLKNDQKMNNPATFFKKMMAETVQEEKASREAKVKVDVKEKLKSLGTPQNLLYDQNTEKRAMQAESRLKVMKQKAEEDKFYQLKIFQAEIESSLPQPLRQKVQQNERLVQKRIKMAEQDIMLEQIMKNTKIKELRHINQKEDTPDETGLTEREKKLILREQKIIEALQKREDPSEAKYDLTTEDLLAMKYSPHILQQAHQYRNHELGYFKELILNETDEASQKIDPLERRGLLVQQEGKYKNAIKPDKVKKEIQNTYKSMKSEEGLQLYEDVDFYKQKALKQINEKLAIDPEDKLISESLEKDLQSGNRVSDVFLDDVIYKEDAKLNRKINLRETSFGKQAQQEKYLVQRLNKLGLQFTSKDIKALSRENLFEDKKMLEAEQNFQKYLHKKEKKKNMKKELREVHESIMRDDLDFDKEAEKPITIKQLKETNSIEMLEENYDKIDQFYQQKQASFVEETVEEKKTKIHLTKTFRNMQGMLALYFSNGLFNRNINQLEQIQFVDFVPNAKLTVLNIFWNLEPSYLESKGIVPGVEKYEELLQAEKKKIESKLSKQSGYISGKMTQLLRLRYGPEIRFQFDRKTEQTVEAVNELKQYLRQIAMVEVEELVSKGKITTEEKQLEYFEKMMVITKTKIQEFNSRKLLLSKSFRNKEKRSEDMISSQLKKEQPAQTEKPKKKKRGNPMYEDEQQEERGDVGSMQRAQKKKSAAQKLWDTIDSL